MKLQDLKRYLKDNNFPEKLTEEPDILKMLLKAIFWRRQIELIMGIYLEKFIPASESLDLEVKIEFSNNDNYGISLEQQEFSSVYETIRVGYIALHHKFESFTRDYISLTANIIGCKTEKLTDIYSKELDYKIIKPSSGIIYKVSWISNCIKHNDGIVSERNKPPHPYNNYPKNQRLMIDSDEFKADCSIFLIEFDKIINSLFMVTMFWENDGLNAQAIASIKSIISD